MPFRAWLLLAAAAAAFPAAAIVTRPDRDDAEYLELASRYASAVALGSYGEGALIAPRWILTSANVARAMREVRGALRLRIGAAERGVQAILTPPEGDIALVLLSEPIEGVAATPIYRDADEQRRAVVVAGHGAAGHIGESALVRDGKARAAINTVDRVEPRTLGLRLKGPDDASDLQGAAGPGDEGAPAFIETKGHVFVAGIAQGPRGAAMPRTGDWDLYTRVSSYAEWIDEAMFRAASDEAATTGKVRRR